MYISRTQQEIRSAAERFSAAIQATEWPGIGDDCVTLRYFPTGMCGPASYVLAKYLHDRVGCRSIEFVSGQSGSRSHLWLEYRGLIVDIKAFQFSEVEEPVIVTEDRSWHAQFTYQKRFPYSDIWELDTLDSKVPATYARVLRTLESMPRKGVDLAQSKPFT